MRHYKPKNRGTKKFRLGSDTYFRNKTLISVVFNLCRSVVYEPIYDGISYFILILPWPATN